MKEELVVHGKICTFDSEAFDEERKRALKRIAKDKADEEQQKILEDELTQKKEQKKILDAKIVKAAQEKAKMRNKQIIQEERRKTDEMQKSMIEQEILKHAIKPRKTAPVPECSLETKEYLAQEQKKQEKRIREMIQASNQKYIEAKEEEAREQMAAEMEKERKIQELKNKLQELRNQNYKRERSHPNCNKISQMKLAILKREKEVKKHEEQEAEKRKNEEKKEREDQAKLALRKKKEELKKFLEQGRQRKIEIDRKDEAHLIKQLDQLEEKEALEKVTKTLEARKKKEERRACLNLVKVKQSRKCDDERNKTKWNTIKPNEHHRKAAKRGGEYIREQQALREAQNTKLAQKERIKRERYHARITNYGHNLCEVLKLNNKLRPRQQEILDTYLSNASNALNKET